MEHRLNYSPVAVSPHSGEIPQLAFILKNYQLDSSNSPENFKRQRNSVSPNGHKARLFSKHILACEVDYSAKTQKKLKDNRKSSSQRGDRDPQPDQITLVFCYHLSSSLHSRESAQMDFRTLQLQTGFSSSAQSAYNIKCKRHGAHCHPVPAITIAKLAGSRGTGMPATTADCLNRDSWQRDANTLCHPFPATTAAHFNRNSWRWNASTLCCLFPATIAAHFSRGSWHWDASALCFLFPATTAILFNRNSWQRDASGFCILFPATTAARLNRSSWHQDASACSCFHQPQHLASTEAPGTRMQEPYAAHFQQP